MSVRCSDTFQLKQFYFCCTIVNTKSVIKRQTSCLFSPQVADLGCADCTLLKRLKFHREIELLVGMDINGAKVKKKM